jgi:YD repeat-containing protein
VAINVTEEMCAMVKTVLIGVLVSLFLLCASSKPARGQQVCIPQVGAVFCGWYSWGGPCLPTLPANAFGCLPDDPFQIVCYVVTNACITPKAWCPTCGKYVPGAGHPINLTTGNAYIQETDLKTAGLGGGLTLVRTWNSIIPTIASGFQSGMFGLNWRSTYEERVFQGSGEASGYMVYLRADGGLWYFNTNGTLASPTYESATLTQQGSTSWTITFEDGEQKVFSYSSGALTAVVDRNGNTTNLSYDSIGRLTTVTDPASRQLSFTYQSNTSYLVTGISSTIGFSWSYSYDSNGRLTQVTEPDQSTLSFQYNSQSLISTVLDSEGNTLESLTYDVYGRGLTSSRANGVDAVTVSYPQ